MQRYNNLTLSPHDNFVKFLTMFQVSLTVYVSFGVVSSEVPSVYAFSSSRSGLVPCGG
jgi:hypothetical protein